MEDQHLIFLSYASPDRDRVFEYYDFLSSKGFHVWMDKRRIRGGQNWDFEIKRALSKAAIILVFLSSNSVSRRGYAQREIKLALDQRRDKLIDDIYIIPIALEVDVSIPMELKDIQVLRPEDGDPMQATAEAIVLQLEELGAEAARIQGEASLGWTITEYRDSWDGLPGYESEFQLPRFYSDVYPQVSEISDVMRGWLLAQAMSVRTAKFDQDVERLNFGQSRFERQDSWEASCGDPKVKGRIVTVAYSIWYYSTGAAHPNNGFQTFAFMLDPLIQVGRIEDIFDDPEAAFPIIQTSVRESLLAESTDDAVDGEEPLKLDKEYVDNGTDSWEAFTNFVFGEDGIEFLFASYEVAAYAFGPQSASVPYDKVARSMKRHYACALGIEHLQRDIEP